MTSINPANQYTQMQLAYYDTTADDMAVEDHRGHNANPDYLTILLGDIVADPSAWKGKQALDFGCGTGRNVGNLLGLAPWKQVTGVDIAPANLAHARRLLAPKTGFQLIPVNGVDLAPLPDSTFDFVMSTIVLQHIAVYTIRRHLLEEIYRVMAPGARFSFQMATFGPARYYDDAWDAPHTNGGYDVACEPEPLLKDLAEIGFKDSTYVLRPEWDYLQQRYREGLGWIYINSSK